MERAIGKDIEVAWIVVNGNNYYETICFLQTDSHVSTRDKLTRMVNCSAQMDAEFGMWKEHILFTAYTAYLCFPV